MEVTRTKIKLFDAVTSTEEGLESLENEVNEWLAESSEIKIKGVSATSSQNADGSYKTIVTVIYRATEELETEEEKKERESEESMPKTDYKEIVRQAMAEVMAEDEEKQKEEDNQQH